MTITHAIPFATRISTVVAPALSRCGILRFECAKLRLTSATSANHDSREILHLFVQVALPAFDREHALARRTLIIPLFFDCLGS